MNRLPQRDKLPHEVPAWVRQGADFFLTICCRMREENQLCHPEVAKTIFEAVDYRQNAGRWYVHLLLLMPDHLHAIVSFPGRERMVRVVANFKEVTAKRAGIRWQRDFFDHRLRREESFEEKAAYIRRNPVRKGLIGDETKWPWRWRTAEGRSGGPGGPALPVP
ncbi:MAG TPA: transposase [Candidatus Didemnitutus sp.]|jgi:REP element-mobilizing transposase RayT